MAPLFDAAGEYFSRSSVFSHNNVYSIGGYCMLTVNNDTKHVPFYIDAGSTFSDYDRIKIDWFNGAPGIQVVNGGTDSGQQYGSTPMTINTYRHLMVVRESSTSLKLYVDGVLEVTITTSIAGRSSATRFGMGALAEGSEPSTGMVLAAWKCWTRALTITEVNAEIGFAAAQDATSEWAEWYMLATGQGTDSSGNGRNLTVNGSPTNVTDPSITYPSAGGGQPFALRYSLARSGAQSIGRGVS